MLLELKIEHRTQDSDDDPPYADAIGMEIPASPQEISSSWVFQNKKKAQIHQGRQGHCDDD
jgi:hypothetical protein